MARKTMQRAKTGFVVAAGVLLGLVGLAFLVAPHACQGGFEFYFWFGCGALVLLLGLPFAAQIGRSWLARGAWALGFVALGAGSWIVGLLAANVRFLCGLGYL
jgi:hypothetical protein